MSREIDERIVQMKFENGQFERGVQTSINTMNSLKKSMNFEESIKGFESLDRAAKNIKIDGIGGAVDAVKMKFSALQVVAITALTRITNQAISTGTTLIKSLSTDNISAGFQKFADKTSSVQTIMAATSTQFADTAQQMSYVENQLEKLNWFTDETSYNFVDMVNNIGKFTSNNIELDKSVTAMQGIANWAAVSGANANEASRAMYNISQALATGTVRLIDWKSIELANMATTEFKKTVIDIAEEQGKLLKVGEDTWTTLDKKVEVSASKFNEGLSKGWFTNDVLLEALERYGGAANKLNEIYNEFQGIVPTSRMVSSIEAYTKALETARKESEANQLSAEATAAKVAEAGKKVATTVSDEWGISVERATEILNEFDDESMKFGLRAFKMAQEAKTFGDVINAIQDEVSTGWMNTFEILFGNYEEAKTFWTDIRNTLSGIFSASSVTRNKMLRDWKAMGGREYFIDSIHGTLAAINSILLPIKKGMQEAFGGPMTAEGLFNLTKNLHTLIGNLILSDENMRRLSRTVRGLFSILDIAKTVIFGGVSKAFKLLNGLLGGTGSSALEFTANIGDAIYSFRNWFHESSILNDAIDILIDTIIAGKVEIDNFVDAFKNFPVVQAIFKGVVSFFRAVFTDIEGWLAEGQDRLRQFYDYLRALPKIKSLDDLQAIFEVFKKTVLDGWADLSDLLPTARRAIEDGISSLVDKLGFLGPPIQFIIDVFKHAATELGIFVDGINAVDIAIVTLGVTIFAALNKMIKLFGLAGEIIENVGGGFKSFGQTVKKWIKTKQIISISVSLLMLAGAIKILSGVDIKRAFSSAAVLAALAAGLIALTAAMSKIKGGKVNAVAFLALGAGIMAISLALSYIDTKGDVMERLKILGTILISLAGIAILMTKMAPSLVSGGTSILAFAVSVHLLISALNKLAKTDTNTIAKGLPALVVIMTTLGIAMRVMGHGVDSTKTAATALSLIGFAEAIKILLGALKTLSKMQPAKVVSSIVALGVMMTELAIAMRIMGTAAGGSLKAGGSILALALALNIIIPAIKGLAKLDKGTLEKGRNAIMAIGVIFVAAIGLSRLSGEDAHKAGLMLIEMSAAITLLVVAVRALGLIDDKQLAKGVLAVDAIGAVFVAAIAASKNAEKAKGAIIALTAAVTILAFSVYELSKIDFHKLAGAAGALGGVIIALGVSMKLMKDVGANKGLIITITALAAVVYAFSKIIGAMVQIRSIDKALWAAGAISLVLISLAESMKIISGSTGVITDNTITGLAAMGAIAVGLGGLVLKISEYLPNANIKSAIGIAGAVAVLMPVLTGCFVGLSKAGAALPKGMMGQFSAMAVVIGLVGALITAITAIPGSDAAKAVKVVQALDILLPVLTVCFYALSKITVGPNKTVMRKFEEFAVIAGVLGVLIGVLAAIPLKSANDAIRITYSLEFLIGALILCFGALSLIRRSPSKSVIGSFAIFSGIVAALGAGIAALTHISGGNLEAAIKIVRLINTLIPVMTACFAGMSLLSSKSMSVGDVATFGLFGVIASAVAGVVSIFATYANLDYEAAMSFVRVINTLLPMLAGISALFSLIKVDPVSVSMAGLAIEALGGLIGGFLLLVGQIPTDVLQSAAQNGSLLGQAIGGFFGGVLGGFAGGTVEAIASTFPAIGTHLTNFWYNAEGFIDGMRSIDSSVLAGVGILTGTLIALTAAEFVAVIGIIPGIINSVANALGISPTMTEKFTELGKALAGFSGELEGVDAEKVRAAADACSILGALEANIPPKGGTLQTFFGTQDLGQFGERLKTFGTGLSNFALTTGWITKDKVEGAYNAGDLLSKLENSLPPQGGHLQVWVGRQDLAAFGNRLVSFGSSLSLFALIVQNVTKSQVQGAYNAGDLMSQLENSLPYSGGTVTTWFFGSQDLGQFGQRLSSFGTSLVTYVNTTKGITEASVSGSAAALTTLSDIEKKLDTNGGLSSIFFGDNSFGRFGANLESLGSSLVSYSKQAANIDYAGISNVNAILRQLLRLGEEVKTADDWVEALLKEVRNMVNLAMREIDDNEAKIERRGKDIIKWLVNGLDIGVDTHTKRTEYLATKLATTLNDKFRETLKISSPSVVMEENGMWIVRGIAEGITKDTSAEQAIKQKAENIKTAFTKAMENVSLQVEEANVGFQLWRLTDGKNATEAEIFEKQLEVHRAELDKLAENAKVQAAQAEALGQLWGLESTEYRSAIVEVKKAQIELINKVNEVNELQGVSQKSERETMKAFADTMKDMQEAAKFMGWTDEQLKDYAAKQSGYDWRANNKYQELADEYRETFKFLGKSDAEFHAFLKEKSGFGAQQVNQAMIDTNAYLNEALAKQSVTIEQTMTANVSNSVAKSVSNGVKQGLTTTNESVSEAAVTTGKNVVEGIKAGVEEKAPESIRTLYNRGQDLMNALNNSTGCHSPSVISYQTGQNVIRGLINGMNDLAPMAITTMRAIGNNLMAGFKQGIEEKGAEAIAAAQAIANAVAARMRAALRINSPSKVTQEIGSGVGEGFAKGIKEGIPSVNYAVEDLSNSALHSLDYAKSAIDNVLQSDDYAPVITPVLDMDTLKQEARGIPGLFGNRAGISVRGARIQAQSIMASEGEIQNGRKQAASVVNNYDMTQNNYSPKALSRVEIYRQTKNEFARLKGATQIR